MIKDEWTDQKNYEKNKMIIFLIKEINSFHAMYNNEANIGCV